MKIREMNNAERDAWRQRGLDKAEQLIASLDSSDLNEKDRFDRLDTLLESVKYSVDHCRENFNDAGEYCPKDGLHTSDLCQKDIDDLAGTAIKAQALGEVLTEEMKRSPLSRINGTSVIFNKWAEKFGLATESPHISIPQSAIVIQRELAYK